MSDPNRFTDTGASLQDYATHFVVHCPICNGKALIRPHEASWRLTCTQCHHVEMQGHWYGTTTAYVKVKCRECGEVLTRSAEVSGQWSKLMMKCPSCSDTCEYEAHITHHQMHDGWMCDRIFGLRLWLQDTFGHDLFWAYNYEHLEIIEQYVQARLRERKLDHKGSRNSLMFSRLPGFITKAGNRERVLKFISELQVKEK